MEPALTAEEWEQGFAWIGPHMVLAERTATQINVGGFDIRLNAGGGTPGRAVATFTPEQAHAIAALALAYQPFGFTQEDVTALRVAAQAAEADAYYFRELAPEDDRVEAPSLVEWSQDHVPRLYNALADRLEALLPPEKEGA